MNNENNINCILKKCEICPHKCKVNRINNVLGRCRANSKIKIAKADLFFYEEPCMSGKNGSGTIFFSNCNLRCVYCQNYEISCNSKGVEISSEKLADIMINLQQKNADNINLVTPTIYIPQIIESIKLARKKGLNIPIIYNTNGYENIESLKLLKGYIDVYLPDLKYAFDDLGKKYSGIDKYFEITTQAIKYMYEQVGDIELNSDGLIQRGVVIRHLILPNQIDNSKKVLKWVKDNFDDKVMISLMAQYFPTHKAKNIDELNRKINKKEYSEIQNYLFEIGLYNGYIQELGKHEEEYVPDFDLKI